MTDWAPLLTLGFTGTRDIRSPDVARIMDDARPHVLDPKFNVFVTGGALGVDGLLGRYAADLRPDGAHVVVVPADESRVDPWWTTHRPHLSRDLTLAQSRALAAESLHLPGPGLYVCRMPEGSTYRDRDNAMAVASTYMRGYAAHPEDHPRSKRSGTWLTKRLADVHRRPIAMTVLR